MSSSCGKKQGLDSIPEAALWSKKAKREEDVVGVKVSEDNLTCNESIEASSVWENQLLPNPSLGELDGFALSDLDNADLGTPPDFLTVRSKLNHFVEEGSLNLDADYEYHWGWVGFAVSFSGQLDELDGMAVTGLLLC